MVVNEHIGLYFVSLIAKEQLNRDIPEVDINKPSKSQRRKPSRFASLVKRKAK